MILHHHERWDGRGYPTGLAGTDIPHGARILHVADAMDAMFSMRSYKDSYPIDKVCEELEAGRATQFDPEVVDATLEWLRECPDEIIFPEPTPEEEAELELALT
jgi:putative two-component system response regulator